MQHKIQKVNQFARTSATSALTLSNKFQARKQQLLSLTLPSSLDI